MKKLKTLKDVVAKNNPECINPHTYVKKCPSNYDYLKDHYNGTCEQFINCEDCWNQPYIPFEDVKTDRERIIEGAKIMRNICKENIRKETVNDCKKCSIYDICFEFDYASLDGSFTPECIGELPEK